METAHKRTAILAGCAVLGVIAAMQSQPVAQFIAQTTQTCTDSDSGLTPNKKGTVHWESNGTSGYNDDYCFTSTGELMEQYCDGNTPSQQAYTCTCELGRCVEFNGIDRLDIQGAIPAYKIGDTMELVINAYDDASQKVDAGMGWAMHFSLEYLRDSQYTDAGVNGVADYHADGWHVQLPLPNTPGEYVLTLELLCPNNDCDSTTSSFGEIVIFDIIDDRMPKIVGVEDNEPQYTVGDTFEVKAMGVEENGPYATPERDWEMRYYVIDTLEPVVDVTDVVVQGFGTYRRGAQRWYVSFPVPEKPSKYNLVLELGCFADRGCPMRSRAASFDVPFTVLPRQTSQSAASSSVVANAQSSESTQSSPVEISIQGSSANSTATSAIQTSQPAVKEPVESTPSEFPDINPYSIEGQAVMYLATNGVINGFPDGTFQGEAAVNRAQAAKLLMIAADIPLIQSGGNSLFWDTEQGAWYAPYIEAAALHGIIAGNPDGSFRPGNTVNTAEFLKMVTLAFGLPKGLRHTYVDVSEDAWFADYAGNALFFDLFPTRPTGKLMPGQPLNRYEVSFALYQILTKL